MYGHPLYTGVMSNEAPHILIRWPDGTVLQADSAAQALIRLAAEQFSPTTVDQLKEQLTRRAMAWPGATGQFVHPAQPDEPFLVELFRVGLYELEIDGERLVRR